VWFMTVVLYVALYFEWLKKGIIKLETISKRFKKKS
jgi:hypothetical protein